MAAGGPPGPREPGDDLRLVHWRSSAKVGTLLVKHNVDTSQPFTVVVFAQRPGLYTEASFEQGIDVAPSAVVASAAGKAPVGRGLPDGPVLGGARMRDVTPLIDHLTGIDSNSHGSLRDQLLALRRTRGGTSLVVVTGELDPADLHLVANLRRRFEHLMLISIDPEAHGHVDLPGVRVIVAPDADAACIAWNLVVQ